MSNTEQNIKSKFDVIAIIAVIASIVSLISFLPILTEKLDVDLTKIILAVGLGIAASLLSGVLTKTLFSKRSGRIFIIYSYNDSDFVAKLVKDLKKSRFEVYWDKEVVMVGDNIQEVIKQNLLKSDVILAIVSEESLQRKYIHKELEVALENKKKVLPIVLDENLDLPPELIKLKYANFSKDYFLAYQDLRKGLVKAGKKHSTQQSAKRS